MNDDLTFRERHATALLVAVMAILGGVAVSTFYARLLHAVTVR